MFRAIILPIFRSTRLCVTACGIMHPRCCQPPARQHRGNLRDDVPRVLSNHMSFTSLLRLNGGEMKEVGVENMYMVCYWSSIRWSQLPRSLRRRCAAAHLLRSWVRIPPGAWMLVCCVCFVLSSRGLCDKLITRPEESYRLWYVVMCDLATSLTFRHRASSILGQAFRYSPENAFYIFNQQIYFII